MSTPKSSSSSATPFISREFSKYNVTYAGKTIETIVTDKSAVAANWVGEITTLYGRNQTLVGFVVGQRSQREYFSTKDSATLQLCVEKKCLILQLVYVDKIPEALKSFLLNPNFTFVRIVACDDVLKLKKDYGLHCTNIVNIRDAAKKWWPGLFQRPGLEDLARLMLGSNIRKPKGACSNKFEERVFSEDQVQYACIDAYDSYNIGHYLIMEK